MPHTINSLPYDSTSAWFITGCSTGFGHELATQLLVRGNPVAVTARKTSDLAAFASHKNALVLELDVTNQGQIAKAVQAAEARFGQIDVLVNNAGIGYFAAVEEGEDAQIRKMFDLNVFGIGAMLRAVLPGMRHRKRGFVVNFSSIGGLRASPAIGWYNASKFAVEGLTEALWQEVEPLGLKVMLVEPSGFRTDWAGRSAQESAAQIADYAATAGRGRHHVRAISGHQAGDPVRAIKAVIAAVDSKTPPHRLLLGSAAYDGAMTKLADLKHDFAKDEHVSRGADYPAAELTTRH